MKVLQTIAGFSAKSGGISTSVYDLISAIQYQAGDVDLLTPQVTASMDLLMGNEPWIKVLPYDYISPYGFSHNLTRFLYQSKYDIYHTNGLWMHINHTTCSTARKKGKPYIITPHGMLYPQALARSAWKKRLLLNLGFRKDIAEATVIQATCMDEFLYYRDLGFTNPVAIIPNPVPHLTRLSKIETVRDKRRIGYLGRLHPRKRVKELIEAWILLGYNVNDAELIIMGVGEESYERELHNLVRKKGLKNVIFTGFIQGETKFEKLASLTALCVPSDFENFGMIIPEALSAGTPVITSKGTPWQILNERKCGWWINNDITTLSSTIQLAFSKTDIEIAEMGQYGKILVEENFSDERVAKKMLHLYDYISDGGEKPEFIYE